LGIVDCVAFQLAAGTGALFWKARTLHCQIDCKRQDEESVPK